MAVLDKLEAWLKERRPPEPFVELYKLVMPTEVRLRLFVQRKLQQAFGKEEKEWWAKGVPEETRINCTSVREKDLWRKELIDYTYFIDLKKVMEKKGNWKFFEEGFRRIKEHFKSKDEFLSSLVKLNELRNRAAHPSLTVLPAEDDLEFARLMRAVIEKFASPG